MEVIEIFISNGLWAATAGVQVVDLEAVAVNDGLGGEADLAKLALRPGASDLEEKILRWVLVEGERDRGREGERERGREGVIIDGLVGEADLAQLTLRPGACNLKFNIRWECE